MEWKWKKEFEKLFSHEDVVGDCSCNKYEVGDFISTVVIPEVVERAKREESERIEQVFKDKVPPHGLSLEDGVWLKRLLNSVFGHKK